MDTMAITPYQFTLDSAIAEWLAQKEIRTGSRRTWRSYRDALASFRAFLAQVNLGLLSDPVDTARLAPIWASTRTLLRHQPESDLVKPVAASTYNQRLRSS